EGRRRAEGVADPAHRQGREALQGPVALHRGAEAGRPQRQRRRAGHEDHRGHRPVDGDLGGGVIMGKNSKSYREAVEKIEPGKFYAPDEAVSVIRETGSKKFDSTVEVALKLGVDPRKADQMVRGTVILPHGTGKTA